MPTNAYTDMMTNLNKYVTDTPGAEPRSVESMMGEGAGDEYTGTLGTQYLDEFMSRLTSMSGPQQSEFKSYLPGGVDPKEWADIVGLDPAEAGQYSEWFGGLPTFSDLMSNIANIEEYGKARKKHARTSLRSKSMQASMSGGRGGKGFTGGRAMLSGALKGSLLRDALKSQMFSINEDVGKRYGQLTASVGDALSKAYGNLRALRAQMPEDEVGADGDKVFVGGGNGGTDVTVGYGGDIKL
tara:strand:- start:689 stop:1411 length:723 start_codon:yes stop_codon:yes gene_type:complete